MMVIILVKKLYNLEEKNKIYILNQKLLNQKLLNQRILNQKLLNQKLLNQKLLNQKLFKYSSKSAIIKK